MTVNVMTGDKLSRRCVDFFECELCDLFALGFG